MPRKSWGAGLGGCLLVVTACSPSVTKVAAPDGKPAWVIDCANAPAAMCEIAAQERCPQGYRVIASRIDRIAVRCRELEAQQEPLAPPTPSDDRKTPTADSIAPGANPERSPALSDDSGEERAPARVLENRLVLRLGIGGGRLLIDEKAANGAVLSTDGWGLAVDGMVGYALTRKLAVGGSIAFQHANLIGVRFSDYHVAYENEVPSTLTVVGGTIGIFGIGDTELHADFTGGLAILTVAESGKPAVISSAGPYTRDSRLAPGFGLSGHVAYGFRVSQQLRLDFGVRLMGASTIYDDYSQGVLSYALLVDALYF